MTEITPDSDIQRPGGFRPQTPRRQVLRGAAVLGSAGLMGLLAGPGSAWGAPGAPGAAGTAGGGPVPGAASPALIYSTSFEKAADAVFESPAASLDPTQAHTGTRSLRYSRTDATSYVFTGPAIPGTTSLYDEISASVWVKTAGMTSGGASFCLEWYTSDGCYLTGSYTSSTLATDWTQLKVGPLAAPVDAAIMKVIFFIGRGHTGTAWYDDLSVFRAAPQPLRAKLAAPSYRGLLIPGESEDIDLRVQLFPPDSSPSAYRARVELLDASGNQINARTLAGQQDVRYTHSTSNLPYGAYTLKVSALSTANAVVGDPKTFPLRKIRPSEIPASYIDSHGRLRRNGELFFPLGAYDNPIAAQNLDDLNYAAFNSLITYHAPTTAQMDLTHSKGLSVLYVHQNTDAATVQQFKDHPALLGWYINDEGDLQTRSAELRSRYETILNNDPNHPAYSVDYRVWPGGDEENVTDVYGTDGYPIFGLPNDKPQRVSRLVGATVEEMPGRPIWPVIQISNQGNYNPGRGFRAPTKEEVRSMAWQAIAKGATGLLFYSYFDLLRDANGVSSRTLLDQTKAVVSEIKSLVPAILSTGRLPQVTSDGAEDWLTWTTRDSDDRRRFIFAANTSKETKQVRFANVHADSVAVLGEHRTIGAQGNAFTDTLPALGVGLYELKS